MTKLILVLAAFLVGASGASASEVVYSSDCTFKLRHANMEDPFVRDVVSELTEKGFVLVEGQDSPAEFQLVVNSGTSQFNHQDCNWFDDFVDNWNAKAGFALYRGDERAESLAHYWTRWYLGVERAERVALRRIGRHLPECQLK